VAHIQTNTIKALILAGGDLTPTPVLLEAARLSELIIAADSGLRHARTLGVKPDVIVGDFDSVSERDLASYPSVPQVHYPVDKDQLDLEIAIDYALEQGARQLYLAGVLGGRLDQLLAALLIAAGLRERGVAVSLHGSHQDVYLMSEETITLALAPLTLFSVLSLYAESVLSIDNARYPLKDALLEYGTGLGVSNRTTELPLTVDVTKGLIALIIEREDRE
jgi:thiamine pyrophosphokinase